MTFTDEVTQLQAKIQDLELNIASTQKEIADMNIEGSIETEKRNELERDIAYVTRQLADSKAELANYERDIRASQSQIATLQKQLQDL